MHTRTHHIPLTLRAALAGLLLLAGAAVLPVAHGIQPPPVASSDQVG